MKHKTIYLHIGPGKTGTSAIQYFLYKNRNKLLTRGYAYPNLDRFEIKTYKDVSGGNSSLLARSFLEKEHPFSISSDESKRAYDNFIESLQKEKNNIILSSEFFSMLNKGQFNVLSEIIAKHDYKVKVICYLRRHDEIVESDYAQQVKKHSYVDCIDIDFANKVIASYNHVGMLSKLKEVFGIENLVIRVYEKEQFIKRDLTCDFLDSIGISDYESDFIFENIKVNPSPSKFVLEMMRELNVTKNSGQSNITFSLLDLVFETPLLQKNRGERYIPNELIQEIIEKCSMDYEFIAKNYLNRSSGLLFLENEKVKKEESYYDNIRKAAYIVSEFYKEK